ncbi:MAG: hypothetical protein ABI740_05285 [Alphaproteobacteria bacterium]
MSITANGSPRLSPEELIQSAKSLITCGTGSGFDFFFAADLELVFLDAAFVTTLTAGCAAAPSAATRILVAVNLGCCASAPPIETLKASEIESAAT